MTLQQLKYILAVVEYRSITEAARNIYVSQPALSASIHDLEDELGIEIFSRTSKGISLTSDGAEFLSYARQVVEQTDLLEQHYNNKKPAKQLCSFSTQHYAFAISAFANIVKESTAEEYEFTLRETKTYEIIEDVKNLKSETGIIYVSDFNNKIIMKLLKENHLTFYKLFTAKPHVFISKNHPLAKKKSVTLKDMENYPYLCFEQGDFNSFYFSEEVLSTVNRKKIIHVSDRATLFNLVIGIDGYTISTGIITNDLNGDGIISVPLITENNEDITVGYILNDRVEESKYAKLYLNELKRMAEVYEASKKK